MCFPPNSKAVQIISFQENAQQGRLFSAVRGRLRQVAASLQAAIRFRRFSRKESHPPDWFVDKSHQEENIDVEDTLGPTCWGYQIVVDPSRSSYYKVNRRLTKYIFIAILFAIYKIFKRIYFLKRKKSLLGL